MDVDTGAGRGADRRKPGAADRRGLRAGLAVATVAAITTAAGAFVLGGQAAAAPTTLRAGAEAAGRYFGVAVGQGDLGNGTATNVAGSQFDMVTPENEMKWDTVEPNNGQFNFGPGDAIVNFATSHNERVRGHNLVWHSQLPGWVSSLSGSQVKSAMEAHITGEVSHYKGKIYAWDVVNEPFNEDGSFRQDVFYNAFGGGAQYIGDAIRTAHAADPDAKLYINDYNIEGTGSKSNAMYSLAQTLLAQGVPLSGIGFESHFIVGQIPSSLQANMQRFANLGLDVAITELDDRMPTPASSSNLQQQATDDANVVKACLAIARCPGVTQWNISDADSWVPGTFPGQGAATMFDTNYQPKPAFTAVLNALNGASVPPSSTSSSSQGANTVTVTNPGSQSGTVGTAIAGVQVLASDSASGQTLTYSASGLPAGLSISGGSGLISGTPTTAGTFPVTVTVTDTTGASGTAAFTWTISGGGSSGACHVQYDKTSEWPGGFTANVTVTNTGTNAITGWTTGFTFPGDQKITNAWNATTTQTGQTVAAANAPYNATIAPGANTSFGFQGTYATNDTNPTAFTLNGTPCS
ncbi:endo-1,4-beta-xylanase [Catenulispora subtropica]|uniref:Beta-xylanase n=1 Tax=Catenulispora subtropica TaxID=450798 RepID=A0ABP5CTX4_9ACTN